MSAPRETDLDGPGLDEGQATQFSKLSTADKLAGAAQRFGIFLLTLLVTFLGLTAVTFFIGRFIPVDPVLAIVGEHANHDTYEKTRLAIGLDKPVPCLLYTSPSPRDS